MLDAGSLLSKTGSQLREESALLGLCQDFGVKPRFWETKEGMVDGTDGEPVQSIVAADSAG